jgi:hypothetical protein
VADQLVQQVRQVRHQQLLAQQVLLVRQVRQVHKAQLAQQAHKEFKV